MLWALNNHFLLLDAQAWLMALFKKGQIFIKIKSGRATLVKEKIYKCQWKVCYKLNQEIFQKTDIAGESQDICQELAATSGHTKLIFSKIFGRFLKTCQ